MNLLDIAKQRLHNQALSKPKFKKAEEVVSWLGAIQAQDFGAAKWALGLRMQKATDATVKDAFNEGRILRTHVMRPTWHFVAPQDIRALLALTSMRVQAQNAHMYRRLGLSDRVLVTCHKIIAKSLRGGKHLTRAELGLHLKTEGQRLAYIIMHAELEALICSGPRKGKQLTYALLEERVPKVKILHRDEALAAFALRYFTSHGPAQVKDFAWWSGLSIKETQRGIELAGSLLKHKTLEGKTYWFSSELRTTKTESKHRAFLLSIYDEYTIAYRDRSALGAERYLEKLLLMGNALTAVMILDGIVVGTWKRAIQKDRILLSLNPFRKLSQNERHALFLAAERYGTFLGMPVVTT